MVISMICSVFLNSGVYTKTQNIILLLHCFTFYTKMFLFLLNLSENLEEIKYLKLLKMTFQQSAELSKRLKFCFRKYMVS